MTHQLYKPHVVGPENNITTPDLLIDRVLVRYGDEPAYVPVQRIYSGNEIQAFAGDLCIAPAYALIAAGGGVLIAPAMLLHAADHPRATADILLARKAWRYANVSAHVGSISIVMSTSSARNDGRIGDLEHPSALMAAAAATEDELPRGIIAVCAADGAALDVSAPDVARITLADQHMDRSLLHSVGLFSVDVDRMPDRPMPRYTVGPVGEVTHYI